jgi:DNA repair exonuclease SbcCD ATPase subunit
MRIISATIRNYRIHRELHVEFDRSRTLIGGPNESGKSSLVEAIHHALFMKARSGGKYVARIRSSYHPGDPSVTLAFESGGERYKLSKTFTGKQNAAVLLEREGAETLRGDDAEDRIHEICNAEAVAVNYDRLRMQWAHLWVWQGSAGSDPIGSDSQPSLAPTERLRASLGGADVFQSERDTRLAETISAEVNKRFTQKDTPRADSSLATAIAELDAAQQELDAATGALAKLDEALRTIDTSRATIAECDREIVTIREELEAVRLRRAESTRLNRDLARQQLEADAAASAHDEFAKADTCIRDLQAEIASIEEQLAPARDRRDLSDQALMTAEARVTAATTAVSNIARHQASLSARLNWLTTCVHLEDQKYDHARLAERCRLIATARTEADALQAELKTIPDMSQGTLEELEGLERRLADAVATFNAIATRVEVIQSELAVSLDDVVLGPGETHTIDSDSTLRVGNVAMLMIRPGGGLGVDEAKRVRDAAQQALSESLASVGLGSVVDARQACARRRSLEDSLAAKEATVRGLGGTKAEHDLEKLGSLIASLTAEVSTKKPDDVAVPQDQLSATALKEAAEQEGRQLQAASTAADGDLAVARQEQSIASAALKEVQGFLHDAENSLSVKKILAQDLTQRHGDNRAPRLAELLEARNATASLVAETKRAYETIRPDDIERDADRLARAEEGNQSRRGAAEVSRQTSEAVVRYEGTSDPRQRLSQARVRHANATRRHAAEVRQAEAYKLLSDLFGQAQREVEDRFAKPLADQVTTYLQRVFGPDARAVVRYRDNTFKDLALLRADRGNTLEDFSRLSGGTREQVAAATRLAMAELLATDHGGCLPVVFDDSFANSDPERIRSVQGLLDDAAARGLQVIVLSCTPNEYATLGAKRIDLPPPIVRVDQTSLAAVGSLDDEEDAEANMEPPAPQAGILVAGTADDKHAALLAELRAAGGKSGNIAIRRRLGWDEPTYDAVKNALVASGQIETGQGRGGSIRLPGLT